MNKRTDAPFYHSALVPVDCRCCFGRGRFLSSTDPGKRVADDGLVCGQCHGQGFVYVESHLFDRGYGVAR